MAEKGLMTQYERQYGVLGMMAHDIAGMSLLYAGSTVFPDVQIAAPLAAVVAPVVGVVAAGVGTIRDRVKNQGTTIDNLLAGAGWGIAGYLGAYGGIRAAGYVLDHITWGAVATVALLSVPVVYAVNAIVRRKKPVLGALARAAVLGAGIYMICSMDACQQNPFETANDQEIIQDQASGNEDSYPLYATGLGLGLIGAAELLAQHHCNRRVISKRRVT